MICKVGGRKAHLHAVSHMVGTENWDSDYMCVKMYFIILREHTVVAVGCILVQFHTDSFTAEKFVRTVIVIIIEAGLCIKWKSLDGPTSQLSTTYSILYL